MAIDKRTPQNQVDTALSRTSAGPFLAKVISHIDPKYSGDLKVQLMPRTRTSPNQGEEGQTITARYLSPFYGVTSVESNNANPSFRYTQQSYGMWAVPPDPGTTVMVIFVEGQSNMCYWIGCVQDEYMNFMVPGNAATSTLEENTPIQYQGKKLPVGEYNKTIEFTGSAQPTNFPKPIDLDRVNQLQEQGLVEDEIRGITTSSARREVPSAVFGISTPGPLDKRPGAPRGSYGPSTDAIEQFRSRLGGSSFVMDDGDSRLLRKGKASNSPQEYVNIEAGEEGGDPTLPANELTRIRTRTGHQILMHNTEDLIYIANGRGTAWIELSSNGKIDIFAQDSVSIHSDQDFNFHANRDINLNAGQNINMVSQELRSSSADKHSFTAGTTFAVNTGDNFDITAGADFSLYAGANGSLTISEKGTLVSGNDMSIGSVSNLGLEGHNSVKTTSDGNIESWSLGTTKIKADAELHVKSGLATKIQSGNVFGVKATGDIIMKSDANIDIQGAEPPLPTDASLPAAPSPSVPTPPDAALAPQRIPRHEPWPSHENLDPTKFTPDKTRAGGPSTDVFAPSTPDTFARGPAGMAVRSGMQPNSLNDGTGSRSFSGSGVGDFVADIPPDTEPVRLEKQAFSRIFASKLRSIAGFNEEQIYAAIACAESESGLTLTQERGYGGTSVSRIRDIFRQARDVSDAEIESAKQDYNTFFELVYGPHGPTGRDLGNIFTGEGAKFVGRGLIQLTGRGNHQKYGKDAGLIDEGLVNEDRDDPEFNPQGVKIIDDPTILLTDVDASCSVAAAYLKDRYKDFGKPDVLGNMRFAIAGTDTGYNLARSKDLGFFEAKKLPNGEFDPDWIREPDPEPTSRPDDGSGD